MEKKPKTSGGTGKKKNKANRTIVIGGNFARSHYRMTPVEEDVKNCIIAMLQCVLEGQKLNSAISADALDGIAIIPTKYGDILVGKHKGYEGLDDTPDAYRFKVPMQYFIRGNHQGGRGYEQIINALESLVKRVIRFDSEDQRHHYTNIMGIIQNVSIVRPRSNPGVIDKECFVSFSMSKQIVERLLSGMKGFYRFYSDECLSLRSFFSKRIYVLLCGQNVGTKITFPVSEFVSMFGISEAMSTASKLRNKVLGVAETEINEKTGLSVRCSIEGKGCEGTVMLEVIGKEYPNTGDKLLKANRTYPPSVLHRYLRSTALMTDREVLAHSELFNAFAIHPDLLAKLPERWKQIIDRFPSSGMAVEEKIRKERIALLIGTMRGMMEDSGLKIPD